MIYLFALKKKRVFPVCYVEIQRKGLSILDLATEIQGIQGNGAICRGESRCQWE